MKGAFTWSFLRYQASSDLSVIVALVRHLILLPAVIIIGIVARRCVSCLIALSSHMLLYPMPRGLSIIKFPVFLLTIASLPT